MSGDDMWRVPPDQPNPEAVMTSGGDSASVSGPLGGTTLTSGYPSSSYLVSAMLSIGVPSPNQSLSTSTSGAPMPSFSSQSMPTTMPMTTSSQSMSIPNSALNMPNATSPSTMYNPFMSSSGFSFNPRPISAMSVPLNEVPAISPIAALSGPLAMGRNVAQLRSASALPQHAAANTLNVTRGSGKAVAAATATNSVRMKTRVQIGIVPIADGSEHQKSGHGLLKAFHLNIQNSDIPTILVSLQQHALLIDNIEFEAPHTQPICPEIDTAVRSHLTNLHLPLFATSSSGPPTSSSSAIVPPPAGYHELGWGIMQKTRAPERSYYLEWADLNPVDVTLEKLLKLIPHPLDKNALCFNHSHFHSHTTLSELVASVPAMTSHTIALHFACFFGVHLALFAIATLHDTFRRHPWSHIPTEYYPPNSDSTAVLDGLPPDELAPNRLAPNKLTPHSEAVVALDKIAPHSESVVIVVHIVDELAPHSKAVVIVDELAPNSKAAVIINEDFWHPKSHSSSTCTRWFGALEKARDEEDAAKIYIELEARSPEELAPAFISYVQHIVEQPLKWSRDAWAVPARVTKFTPFEVLDFVACWSPTISVTSNSNRKSTWRAFGTLCGIYVARLGLAPLPVSPFFIMTALLALFGSSEDLKFQYLRDLHPAVAGTNARYISDVLLPFAELSILGALDRDLAQQLCPWLLLPWDKPLPSDYSDPARQFIIEVLEQNIIEVTNTRDSDPSPESHNVWLFKAIFKLVFGHSSSILGMGEFIAFRDGLNIQVPVVDEKNSSSLISRGTKGCYQSLSELLDRDDIPRFVLAMYDRRVVDAKDFYVKFIAVTLTKEPGPKDKNKDGLGTPSVSRAQQLQIVRERMFVRRFKRYLTQGIGHPAYPGLCEACMISDEEFASEWFQILIKFQHEDVEPNSSWLHIHTCTATIDIRFTEELNVLITANNLSSPPETATAFDASLHQLLWTAPMQYNHI
ncbi:hypothetical protein C8Q74DRAFT_1219410 [Fomes fomentarius]|nr:hypothetical protein C8Q74DRAFT_1219410 [Fomes fomentarius]